MTARLQRGTTPVSCETSTGILAQNAAAILKPLVPNPHSTTFTHGCTRFYHSLVINNPLLLPSNSSILPLHHSSICAQEFFSGFIAAGRNADLNPLIRHIAIYMIKGLRSELLLAAMKSVTRILVVLVQVI